MNHNRKLQFAQSRRENINGGNPNACRRLGGFTLCPMGGAQ